MYDSKQPTKDEKQIKDFMIAKYEKKKYYSDSASQNIQNGVQSSKPSTVTTVTTTYQVNILIFINLYYYLCTFIYRNLVMMLHQP